MGQGRKGKEERGEGKAEGRVKKREERKREGKLKRRRTKERVGNVSTTG